MPGLGSGVEVGCGVMHLCLNYYLCIMNCPDRVKAPKDLGPRNFRVYRMGAKRQVTEFGAIVLTVDDIVCGLITGEGMSLKGALGH